MASHCTGTSALPLRASLASLARLSSVQTYQCNPTCYFQKHCCCKMRFWLSDRHHPIAPVQSKNMLVTNNVFYATFQAVQNPSGAFTERREKKKSSTRSFPQVRGYSCVCTAQWMIIMILSPLFGLNLNLSFSNLISSGVNFFDNLRKKTPTTPQSSATDSSSPRWVYWCFV